MATTYNIVEKRYNGTDYDTLYPATRGENLVSPVPVELGGTGGITGAAGLINLASDVPISDSTSVAHLLSFEPGSGSTSSPSSVLRVPFDSLLAMAGEAVTIMTGSYDGTGTYGSSNPCEITVGDIGNRYLTYIAVIKEPAEGAGDYSDQNVIVATISGVGDVAIPVNRFSILRVSDLTMNYNMYMATELDASTYNPLTVSIKDVFQEAGFSYYSNTAAAQLNEQGSTYRWYAVLTMR